MIQELVVKHVKQINGTKVLPVAIEAENYLHLKGFTSPHAHTNWEQEAMVAYHGDHIVGIITFVDVGWKNEIAISVGYVRPAFRGNGVYRALWDALVVHAQKMGRPSISGDTHVDNHVMQRVMEALGRTAVSMVYHYGVPSKEEV